MATTTSAPIITISPNPPVFDLPVIVAREHGLFAREGIEVRHSADYADRSQSERDVLARLKEAHFETKAADVFNVCEWGSVDRLERSTRGGKIAAWRAAVAAQAIVSFDPSIQEARDLANVPVGVNEYTGSHYTTLQLLEGAIARDEIIVTHAGAPEARYDAVKSGRLRAATVMEPFISLALKDGGHLVAVTFYRGSEVISSDVSDEVRGAYLRAIDAAVDIINADRAAFRHVIAQPAKGALAPEELSDAFVRYVHVEPYPEARFTQAYAWVKSWGLTDGNETYDGLVLP
jgi:NitT/TauT family transport system substrate-binding protein